MVIISQSQVCVVAKWHSEDGPSVGLVRGRLTFTVEQAVHQDRRPFSCSSSPCIILHALTFVLCKTETNKKQALAAMLLFGYMKIQHTLDQPLKKDFGCPSGRGIGHICSTSS